MIRSSFKSIQKLLVATYNIPSRSQLLFRNNQMESSIKRPLETDTKPDIDDDQPSAKQVKKENSSLEDRITSLKHGKGRPIPSSVVKHLSEEDVDLLENVKTSSTDLVKIKAAIQLRIKHRLSIRLPEDNNDSTYYCENGLRSVYPYSYLYQTYAKRRWIGRKLTDVLRQEFRDISDDQLKARFETDRILVNGRTANLEHIIKDSDFICNRTHRHELPVLGTPIKFIHEDKDVLVIDKPPSVPIHPCGRYRHNSIINILEKEYGKPGVKVVHRLDRLVSGVLIIALNSGRARTLEDAIKNRTVQKEYVCRVDGEFPVGANDEDGEITVDEPLEVIPGKISVTVVLPQGKPSVTTFKRLNYNGKTSAVLCKPKTGRMHQIRVHLQYLGHPIVNDTLYNCDAFGPERGKGGRYGKTVQQLSQDVISRHRASTWLITEDSDLIDSDGINELKSNHCNPDDKTVSFINEDERVETLAALGNYFTDQSQKDFEDKWRVDPSKLVVDPSCRDCHDKFHNPPLRSLFLYLHALRYSGKDWAYESELPTWARADWGY